eukprot:1227222-Prymnesium_polylepis.1
MVAGRSGGAGAVLRAPRGRLRGRAHGPPRPDAAVCRGGGAEGSDGPAGAAARRVCVAGDARR